jgi:hypothetical protein
LHDVLHVPGTREVPPPLYLNLIARLLGHTLFDEEETWKVLSPEYYNFLPKFLEEGS